MLNLSLHFCLFLYPFPSSSSFWLGKYLGAVATTSYCRSSAGGREAAACQSMLFWSWCFGARLITGSFIDKAFYIYSDSLIIILWEGHAAAPTFIRGC